MSKVNLKGKNDTEKLFEVIWVERIAILAKIWAKSPEEAVEIAKVGNLDDLVKPFGTFVDSDSSSYVCDGVVEGASKEDYKSGGNDGVQIHY